MAYYRAMRVDELVAWLLERGYAEDRPGYGHVDAETLANELIDSFDVMGYSGTQG